MSWLGLASSSENYFNTFYTIVAWTIWKGLICITAVAILTRNIIKVCILIIQLGANYNCHKAVFDTVNDLLTDSISCKSSLTMMPPI